MPHGGITHLRPFCTWQCNQSERWEANNKSHNATLPLATFHFHSSAIRLRLRLRFPSRSAPRPEVEVFCFHFHYLMRVPAKAVCCYCPCCFKVPAALLPPTNIIYGESPAVPARHDESCPLSATFNANLLAPSSLHHLKRICILVSARVCLFVCWFFDCILKNVCLLPGELFFGLLSFSHYTFRGSFLNEVNQIFMCR